MKTAFITFLSFLFPVAIFAETVVFKSGRTVEATIISKRGREVTLDISGSLASYGLDEIDTIDGKKTDTYGFSQQTQEVKKSISALQEAASLSVGLTYLEQKQFDEAISEFTRVIEMSPDSADAYYNRGLAYAKKNDAEHAIADYSKAIELNPRDSDTYFNRGLAYYKENKMEESIADYTKVIELNPNEGDVYYNRALAYSKNKEYDAAWKDVEAAQGLGFTVNADFIQWLKKASGR